jgi:multicomponent Na+:H+ antiporter subunit D
MASAVALALGGRILPRKLQDGFSILSSAVTACLAFELWRWSQKGSLVYWLGNWIPVLDASGQKAAIGICFYVDPISALLAFFVALLGTGALLYSMRYFEAIGGDYDILMHLFLAGMIGVFLSGDVFTLFVFFELMGVTSYALTGCRSEEIGPAQGALNFAVMNTLGGLFVLVAIGLLYGNYGALNMAQLGRAAVSVSGAVPEALLVSSLLCFCVGFLVKAAIFPMHFWLADAHAIAPPSVCALFSGIMAPLGLYAVARIYWTIYAPALSSHSHSWATLLSVVASLTVVLGGVMSVLQNHLKRMLAYSTISHLGVMLLGLSLLEPKASAGSLLYLIGHGLVKASLFFCAGILMHLKKSIVEGRLFGQGRELLVTGSVFALGAAALAGTPFLGLYSGRVLIEEAASIRHQSWIPWILFVGAVLTSGSIFRMYLRIFRGFGRVGEEEKRGHDEYEKEAEPGLSRAPVALWLPAVVFICLPILLEAWPESVVLMEAGARRMMNGSVYQAEVFGEKLGAELVPQSEGSVPFEMKEIRFAAWVPLILSWVFAALSAFRLRAPEKGAFSIVRYLRSLHSGDLRDYTVWFVVGIALYFALYYWQFTKVTE